MINQDWAAEDREVATNTRVPKFDYGIGHF